MPSSAYGTLKKFNSRIGQKSHVSLKNFPILKKQKQMVIFWPRCTRTAAWQQQEDREVSLEERTKKVQNGVLRFLEILFLQWTSGFPKS
jgi:hypothetical protein